MTRTTLEQWQQLDSRKVPTNGIELQVVEHGEGPAVVLCHGFPELGFSWRHQVPALAAAGHRVLVPDMRGYGGSSRPDRVEDYDVLTLCDDLVGLLDEAGLDDAVFVGHDWGASVVWQLALAHPGRVRAVVGLSVPATRRSPVPPVQILRARLGDDFYMCWFQEPGVADAVLAGDVHRSLTTDALSPAAADAERAEGSTGDTDPSTPAPSRPWWGPEELEHYVTTFERTGFTGGLNYYRNLDRNWELTEHLEGRRITQPAMYLVGSEDPVAVFTPTTWLEKLCTDLRRIVVVPGAGHWIQQERPEEVTEALLQFLRDLDDSGG